MNEADFQVICKSMPYLKTLDLSEINNTVLPDKCFYESYNVRHIILPETLISIGAQMFENSALEDVLIPVNVKKIGAAAFRNCSSLENVTFAPNSTLHTIETGAFHGCSVLKTIKIPASVETMEDLSFHECRQLEEVIWDNESKLTKLNRQIFGNCISLSFIVIPANVREIDPDAFNGCSSLSAVIFENNSQIEVVDGFQGCGLKSIRIPQSVHTIKHGAFRHCKSLQVVDASACVNLKGVGEQAFWECDNLTLFKVGALYPPQCEDNNFSFPRDSHAILNSVLQVPSGQISYYSSSEGWKNFHSIIELSN